MRALALGLLVAAALGGTAFSQDAAAPTPPPGSVTIDQTDVSPAPPLTDRDKTYTARILGSVAAAQGLQGPLDGGWTVTDANGAPIYTLQLVDPANRTGPLGGAFRKLNTASGFSGSGLIETITEANGFLTAQFTPTGGMPATLALKRDSMGEWSGALTEGGMDTPVSLIRNVITAPDGVPLSTAGGFGVVSPYYVPPKASGKKAVKRKATARRKAPVKKKATAAKRPLRKKT